MVTDMRIGAVNAYSFQPYVYNTNTVSAASMNKLSKISDDVLDKKTDYSELVDESQNENPLKKGQTIDFQGMLERQMQKGRLNAAKVMKPVEEIQETEEAKAEDTVSFSDTLAAETAENVPMTEEGFAAANHADSGYSSYQMQQAISAYEMMMTA